MAVITNGTAILGLGDLGALASKPVMEGKSVLFKRFADVDSIDIEVSTRDPDELITVVKNIGITFGGINLEDIKSPECFRIETELQELLDIPVFHDDQHGTAIISAAGLINACHITGRKLSDVKVVLNGAGAAGIATVELFKAMGVKPANVIAVDTKGVIFRGRTVGMTQEKSALAVETEARTLEDAMIGADVFVGLSVKGAVTQAMVKSMGKNPLIFAMANPDPEITPEDALAVRPDAIVATGRSDYPNQVNNVLGFPYIFRGALDVRARRVNLEMKIACANALAQLAREDVPDEVAAAYHGRQLKFGPGYIIPSPFDPRLISYIPPFVAQAAMDSGVARKPIEDMDAYRASLAQRLDPTAAFLQKVTGAVQRAEQKKIVFAEGEEPSVIRAAHAFQTQGLGKALLVGREDLVRQNMIHLGIDPEAAHLEVINARLSHHNEEFTQYLYGRLQREGYLLRDCQRLINQDIRRTRSTPRWWRARPTPSGTGHRRTPVVFDVSLEEVPARHRPRARRPPRRHVGDPGQGPHPVRRRHQLHRTADRQRTGRDRAGGGQGGQEAGHQPAARLPVLLDLRQPPGRPGGQGARRRRHARRHGCGLRIRGRDAAGTGAQPRSPGRLPVHAPERPGQCADHAGRPLRRHLHQAPTGARRGDGDRAAADRHEQAGADLPPVRLGLDHPQHGDVCGL